MSDIIAAHEDTAHMTGAHRRLADVKLTKCGFCATSLVSWGYSRQQPIGWRIQCRCGARSKLYPDYETLTHGWNAQQEEIRVARQIQHCTCGAQLKLKFREHPNGLEYRYECTGENHDLVLPWATSVTVAQEHLFNLCPVRAPDTADTPSKLLLHGKPLELCAVCENPPQRLHNSQDPLDRPQVAVLCICGHRSPARRKHKQALQAWNDQQHELQSILSLARRCTCGTIPRLRCTKLNALQYCLECPECIAHSDWNLTAKKALDCWNSRLPEDTGKTKMDDVPQLDNCALCGGKATCYGAGNGMWLAHCRDCGLGRSTVFNIPSNCSSTKTKVAKNWNAGQQALLFAPKQHRGEFLKTLCKVENSNATATALVASCARCNGVPKLDNRWSWCPRCHDQHDTRGLFSRHSNRKHCVDIWNQEQATIRYGEAKENSVRFTDTAQSIDAGCLGLTVPIVMTEDTISVAPGSPVGITYETPKEDSMDSVKQAFNDTNTMATEAIKQGGKQAIAVQAQQAIMDQMQKLLGDQFPQEFYGTPLGKVVLDIGACYVVHGLTHLFPQMPAATQVAEYSRHAMTGVAAQSFTPMMAAAQILITGVAEQAQLVATPKKPTRKRSRKAVVKKTDEK